MDYLFAFQFWYGKPLVENQWGGRDGAESIVLLIFVLWGCFACRWVRSGMLGQKILLRASLNPHLFPISMIHSGLLYRLDISTFYFYDALFQIFLPCKFINISSFPFLVSLLHLQSTVKNITISINIFFWFCCFEYYTVMVYRKKRKMLYMVYFKWSTVNSL